MSEQEISSHVASVAVNYNINEFIDGQRDCRDGIAHKAGKTESYDKGYEVQYELEQLWSRYGRN